MSSFKEAGLGNIFIILLSLQKAIEANLQSRGKRKKRFWVNSRNFVVEGEEEEVRKYVRRTDLNLEFNPRMETITHRPLNLGVQSTDGVFHPSPITYHSY